MVAHSKSNSRKNPKAPPSAHTKVEKNLNVIASMSTQLRPSTRGRPKAVDSDDKTIQQLCDMGEKGSSSKCSESSAMSLFRKFLKYGNYPEMDAENFAGSIQKEMIGKLADYMFKVKNYSWNTSMSYLSAIRSSLEENHRTNLFKENESWYSRLRDHITKSYMEKAQKEGSEIVDSAPPMTPADLVVLAEYLFQTNDFSNRALLILLFQVMGRINESAETSIENLGFNEILRCMTINWNRFKTVSRASYNIFPDACHWQKDLIHAFATLLLMTQSTSNKLFPHITAGASSFVNSLLENIESTISVPTHGLKSHSGRKGAPTFCASNPDIQVQWIADRGAWLIESINRVFLYICSTSQNDAKVGRCLSGWTDVNQGAFCPTFPNKFVTDSLLAEMFGRFVFNLPKKLLESMSAS